jgi:hypothetical protein
MRQIAKRRSSGSSGLECRVTETRRQGGGCNHAHTKEKRKITKTEKKRGFGEGEGGRSIQAEKKGPLINESMLKKDGWAVTVIAEDKCININHRQWEKFGNCIGRDNLPPVDSRGFFGLSLVSVSCVSCLSASSLFSRRSAEKNSDWNSSNNGRRYE